MAKVLNQHSISSAISILLASLLFLPTGQLAAEDSDDVSSIQTPEQATESAVLHGSNAAAIERAMKSEEARGRLVTAPDIDPEAEADTVPEKPEISTDEQRPESDIRYAKIYWLAPETASESYLLKFGTNPANLNKQITVPYQKLQKYEDPVHGPMLGYSLKLKTVAEKIFYSLQAISGKQFSDSSPVAELELTE